MTTHDHPLRRALYECGISLRFGFADRFEDLARGLVMAGVAAVWILILVVASVAWLFAFPTVYLTGAVQDGWRPIGRLIRRKLQSEDES